MSRSDSASDLEKQSFAIENHIGFAEFAKFIASDHDLSLYKCFADVSARNLLYLQAELQYLTLELEIYDKEDQHILATSQDEKEKLEIEKCARTWSGILHQGLHGPARSVRRLEMIKELRQLMKEYEEALLRRSHILSLAEPEKPARDALCRWFRHTKPLRGIGWHLVDDEHDLIALTKTDFPDRMTKMIKYSCGYVGRDRRPNSRPVSWGPIYHYKNKMFSRIVAIMAVVMVVSLLAGAIVVLYFVKSVSALLRTVTAYTVAFAAVVGLLTNPNRMEIFGATAAYAAVLVVFVGEKIKKS